MIILRTALNGKDGIVLLGCVWCLFGWFLMVCWMRLVSFWLVFDGLLDAFGVFLVGF